MTPISPQRLRERRLNRIAQQKMALINRARMDEIEAIRKNIRLQAEDPLFQFPRRQKTWDVV